MRSALTTGLALLLFCAPLAANKKPQLPKEVVAARYVHVQNIYGSDFDTRVPPEDHLAVGDVEKAIQTWGKYTLTLRASEADLIIVVRKGRLLSANGGVKVGGGRVPGSDTSDDGVAIGKRPPSDSTEPRTSIPKGVYVGAESGSKDDALLVYLQSLGGVNSAPVWMKMEEKGLEAPDLALFKEFKAAVEAAASHPPKKK